jgi:hypothetical protein
VEGKPVTLNRVQAAAKSKAWKSGGLHKEEINELLQYFLNFRANEDAYRDQLEEKLRVLPTSFGIPY